MAFVAIPAAADDAKPIAVEKKQNTHRVLIDGKLFTELIHGATDQFGDIPRPFLYPIIGPTGAQMTRNFPMRKDVKGEASDHPHHRSLWFTHGNVNGTDFWHRAKATIQVVDTNLHTNFANTKNPIVTTVESWRSADNKEQLHAWAIHRFHIYDDGSRIIDIHRYHQVGADAEQVVFGDTKEGTMAIRLAPQLRLKGEVATGKAINSEGDKDTKVWGKRAKWVAYWGQIDGKTCGVAIFDHPSNLRHPTWWHARDYGLVAANPFGMSDFEKGKHKRGDGDYTLKQDETLSLRYRFVFFAGTAEEADIAGKYDEWVKETTEAE
ncbi:MAG: PmoA family protein [Planctomycetota bacterium]